MTPPLFWHQAAQPQPGARQMELDRALLRHATATGEAWLRFYSWSPPAVSLGFHQSPAELDPEALRARGVDTVVRPTGGSAVLHDQEITYALAAPWGDGFGSKLADIYGCVADALVRALASLDLEVDRGGDGRPEGFSCFGAAQGHEITVGGRKLVGSALRRSRGAFLVHGSILTGPGHLDLVELVAEPTACFGPDPRTWLDRRTVDLAALGVGADRHDELTRTLARGLAAAGGRAETRRESLPG